MATQGFIRVPPDSTGNRVDAASVDDGGVAVYRQKIVVCGASGSAEVVATSMSAPAASAIALVVREAGTLNVNAVAISGTATVTGSVTISGTATVAGSVVISGTATVAGNVNISATASIIGIVNISATALVAITRIYSAPANPSASRGPRMVLLSASANATIVAAPGAGMAIFVTSLMVSNASGTNSRARIGSSATPGNVTMMMAASGGGFTTHYEPPWKLSANEALLGSVKPSVSEAICNVHFFVASADAL